MDHAETRDHYTDDCESGACRASATARRTDPRGALQRRDETTRSGEPRHRREYAGFWVGLATILVVFGAATLARAADDGEGGSLTIASAVILGIVQGITEFLPISSDGHLALGQVLLDIDASAGGHRFTIALHAGTLLAVIWTYRVDLIALAKSALRPTQASEDRRLLVAMLVASVPLGIAVLPGVEELVIAMTSQVRWVGVWLLVTAAALWFGFRHERLHPPKTPGAVPTHRQAFLIGLAQVTAILPGLSRSGTTISSALALGLDRAMAARFSFLLSVIAVSGAVSKEVLELVMHEGDAAQIEVVPYLAGFGASLLVGLVALRGLLLLVGRGRVLGFVVYLGIIGTIAIVVG